MNERIREIVEQCEEHPYALHKIDLEKFAELLVEECRNVLTDVYHQVPLECCGHFLYADEVLAKHFYGVSE